MTTSSKPFSPSRYMLAKCTNSYTSALLTLVSEPRYYKHTLLVDTVYKVFKPNWKTAAESHYIIDYHINELNVRFEDYHEREQAKLNFLALLSILPQSDIDTYISTFLPLPPFTKP